MVVYKNKPNILSNDVASAQVLFGFIIFLFGGEFKPRQTPVMEAFCKNK